MCGIYGELSLSGRTVPGAAAAAARQAMAHRGPDGDGVWSKGPMVLGMRRLAVIDLETGRQPMWDAGRRYCIVYNGELYNFQDLREELEGLGVAFRTRSDTEVVVNAWARWGADCLCRFNGMFALAIWDTRDHTLALARDRVGEKPLYVWRDAHRLVFASEIKAILADPSIPRELNSRGLANFLAFGHGTGPDTILRGVTKLLPGHVLIAKDGRIESKPYWEVGDEPQFEGGRVPTEAEAALRLRELLEDAVRRRLVADVPLGAFLSGGLDSTAVVALMCEHATGPVKTFSLGFAAGGAFDELPDAARVARHFGTEHHELRVEHVDLVNTLRTLAYHYDEPFGDPAGFPVYLLSLFARDHVKVVLTGDGGDELFGGYRRYAADLAARYYRWMPSPLVDGLFPGLVQRFPRHRRLKKIVEAMAVHEPARRYATFLEVFGSDLQAELLLSGVLRDLAMYDPAWAIVKHYYGLGPPAVVDEGNRLMHADLKTWLPDRMLEKTDKATMAASLEARAPLVDHRLVELAFGLPSSYKIRGLATKRVLRRAVRGLVPDWVLRKRKRGFAVPTDPWLRKELHTFAADILLDGRTARRGLFDMDVVERLMGEHVSGRHVRDRQLWLLVNFELWARIYLDREGL